MRFKTLSFVLFFAVAFMLLTSPASYARKVGDINDDTAINLSDVIDLAKCYFGTKPCPDPVDVGDVNCDCSVNLSDVIALAKYYFGTGPKPCGGDGIVVGYVIDSEQQPIEGTKAILKSYPKKVAYSNADGKYVFKKVPSNATSKGLTEYDLELFNCCPEVNTTTQVTEEFEFVVLDPIVMCDAVIETVSAPRPGGLGGNAHWTADRCYLLDGEVSVVDGETLFIDQGAYVMGRTGQPSSFLAVQQGGKIFAEGNADDPIVFTSGAEPGNRRGGDWGGLMIFGYGKMNTGCGIAEGDAGNFGCECDGVNPPCDEHDNTGVLKYIRIEFAGVELGPGNELNGLAMYGVGDSTKVEYLQVHRNFDDGIEWFGGYNNSKYVLISECYDDHFDWTDGAKFKAQFVALRGYGGDPGFPDVDHWGDRMMECDNQENDFYLLPRSNPTVMNVTIVGGAVVRGGMVSNDRNIYFRHGTAGRVYNMINMDATSYGFDYANVDSFAWKDSCKQAGDSLWSSVADCDCIDRQVSDCNYAMWYNNIDGHYRLRTPEIELPFSAAHLCDPTLCGDHSYPDVDPEIWSPRAELYPNLQLRPTSPAKDAGKAMPPGDPLYTDPFWQYTDYLGAFDVSSDSLDPTNDWSWPWAEWEDK